MMAAEPTSTAEENEKRVPETVVDKEEQRKSKLETYLTSGCGYGRKKQRLVETFWSVVWSGLEKAGWRKVGKELSLFSLKKKKKKN